MRNLTHDQQKKKAMLPYMPAYYIRKWWKSICGVASRIWATIVYAYLCTALWFMERFITCEYPLGHKNYVKIYKAKMKAEYHTYYDGRVSDYNLFFDRLWQFSTMNRTINKNMLSMLMKSNLMMMSGGSLKTMCGVQPLNGPVGLIYSLRYTYEEPVQPKMEVPSGFLEGSGGRKMRLEVLSNSVEAKARKLNASWSIEAQQDLDSLYALDLGEELARAVTSTANHENLDEFINLVIEECENRVIDCPDDAMVFVGDAFATAACGINAAASDIARTTRRGSGNVLWVNPGTLANIQVHLGGRSGAFVPAPDWSVIDPTGVAFVGTLHHSIKVYCVMLPDGIDALIGYKGCNGESDAGYYHAPYMPLITTGVVMNPDTAQPELGFMTRYGAYKQEGTEGLGNWTDYYRTLTINFDPSNYATGKVELLQEAA